MWILLIAIPPLLALFSAHYVHTVRPARKRREAEASRPLPERREPRDTGRPYPKPTGISADDERLTICPVCGMDDPLFLDGPEDEAQGELSGWPAHRTCVEWLGKWRPGNTPSRPLPMTFVDGAPVYRLGETVRTHPAPELAQAFNAGMITMDEFREKMERLSGAISRATGIPGPGIGSAGTQTCDCGMSFSGSEADIFRSMDVHRSSGQHEQRLVYIRRANAALRGPIPEPISHMWCTCGKEFTGTPAGIKAVLDAHHKSGECPHSGRHSEWCKKHGA